ncbi:MAG: CcdB family protein [Xanthobacteraceae bacterium]|nr:CcdB family protein [Xanthobacteraceae bacterium]
MPQQFDTVENLHPVGRVQYPLLLVLQHDRISSTSGVVVAPLIRVGPVSSRTRLHLAIEVAGRAHLVLIEEMATASRRLLGRVVGTAEGRRYEIVGAIDLLFTGI